MQELTKSQRSRMAIRTFKTVADALGLRGYFRPSDRFGQTLAEALKALSPEIYGSMSDPRVVELEGLEYVIDRLPRGIEEVSRIILTEEDRFENTGFQRIAPFKRRRTAYRVSAQEICFVITRGLSEIYDILTHLTFLYIEAGKIQERMWDESDNPTVEWRDLEEIVQRKRPMGGHELDQAIWNLSIILGRPFHETKASYEVFEASRAAHQSNNGLFSLVYHLGLRMDEEKRARDKALIVYLTPSLINSIGHHKYGKLWAADIKARLTALSLQRRPLHILSANLHSVVNSLYGFGACPAAAPAAEDFVGTIHRVRDCGEAVAAYGRAHGLHEVPDRCGAHVDCQIIDTAAIDFGALHPGLGLSPDLTPGEPAPVIFVMDYAFGAQAFELMESLLEPLGQEPEELRLDIRSIAIMGKAGILSGNKGDIMLATAHVIEGTSDNYIVANDLAAADFEGEGIPVFVGPMITVLGTSLQNRDVLRRLQLGWNTVGLEMEGGHYQRAINAALIKGNLAPDVRLRYGYYASDNPLKSGQTLASGPMGQEGIRPTYLITRVLLQKIFAQGLPGENRVRAAG
jgi:hypothetical protein